MLENISVQKNGSQKSERRDMREKHLFVDNAFGTSKQGLLKTHTQNNLN